MTPSRPIEMPIGARSKTIRNFRSDCTACARSASSSRTIHTKRITTSVRSTVAAEQTTTTSTEWCQSSATTTDAGARMSAVPTIDTRRSDSGSAAR